jgi:exodeoxyribonuclease V beta subunit
MTILNKVADIIIDQHGLIEASAGTGKTYTIENLTIRIIKEKKITLDKILIVTFTEKATGELKKRIREKLEAESLIEKDNELRQLLYQSLDNFDQTSIYTIHGFCQNVLKDCSFEIGENFQSDVVSNEGIYSEILELDIRKNWPKIFGDNLQTILNIVNFKKGYLTDTILSTCKLMKLHEQFKLVPEPIEISKCDFIVEIETCIDNILKLKPNLKVEDVEDDSLNIESVLLAKPRAFFQKKLVQILKWQQDHNSPLGGIKFEPIYQKAKIKDQALLDLVEKIYPYLEKINKIEDDIFYQFANWSVNKILKDAKKIKTENNQISFDDMLIKTEEILKKAPENKSIIEKIRGKYSYAMIDEFQDTDLFQWEIFKTIFMGSEKNRLFLIGDPKQSIYRFRNADIQTYQEARNKFKELLKINQAQIYSLGVNYRSHKKLIDQFNICFKTNAWFSSSRNNAVIGYEDSSSSSEPTKLKAIPSFREPGIYLMKIDDGNKSIVMNQYSKMIVQEIIKIKDHGKDKVNYGHFCCLFDIKVNMAFLIRQFEIHKIPYSVYQENGISESKEAIEISYILEAIDSPHDEGKRATALISTFFRIDPLNLPEYRDLSRGHVIFKKLLEWHDLAEKRQWAKIFNALMEETGLIEFCLKEPGGERKISNYRQIFEWLEGQAYDKKLSLFDLCALVESYQNNNADLSDEEKKMRIDSDAKKVQLMTIFVSKGLEFPFVFNCKYSPGTKDVNSFWVRNQNDFLVVSDPSIEEYRDTLEIELYEEQKRVQYVAFTRAIHSLYIPYCEVSKDLSFRSIVIDSIKPNISKFDIVEEDQIVPQINNQNNSNGVLTKKENIQTLSWSFEAINKIRLKDYIVIKSYSSLKYDHESAHQPINNDKSEARSDDDIASEVLLEVIPKGAKTGNFFHEVFENISFEDVEELIVKELDYKSLMDHKKINSLIEHTMNYHEIDSKWKDSICQVIFSTLTKNLFPFDKEFRLSKLTEKNKIHELEFYYPTSENSEKFGDASYMKGFIDLVFQWKGRYYILDWKSNFLEAGYLEPDLEIAIKNNDFDLQYNVYSVCLFRWLKDRGMSEGDWLNKFGGIVYLFIRGSTESKGCYYKEGKDLPTIAENLVRINQLMGKPNG